MTNKNSINNLEINVEQLYDASGNMIYPLIRFDSRYSVSSPEQLSFPADGEIAYNLKHGVPRFYADKLIEDVEITNDFKSRQIAAYQGNNNESYPLMVFSTAKGDLYSFVPKGTFATEEYVNDEISKVQIGSGGNVDIEALKKYIDGLIDDKLDNVDGNENVNALTIMAYKATDSSLKPDTPTGGSWTRENDGKIEINYPDGWGSPSSNEAVNGKYLWTSSSIQMSDGKFLSDWTLPLCINSDDTLYSDAASIFTSFAFTRNNKNLYDISVTGGDYNNPIPINETHTIGGLDVEVEWYDTVPTNSEEIVWMVKRTFSSNEGDSIDKGWSRPVQMTDTTDFEVIYSAVEAYNLIPDGFSKAEDGVSINSSWLENAHAAGWYDDPEDCLAEDASGNSIKMPPIWMATSKCHNGDWSEWNIVQIKGEDGKDGTKINIKGTYDSYEDLYMAWKNDKTNYAAGDSYVVSFVNVDSSNNWIKPIYDEETQTWINPTDNSKDGIQGVLFVYDGSDEWIFSGQFKGDNAFIHIKYANDASLDDENSFNISIDGKIVTVVPTEPNGEEPGKYIGIYTDNKLEDSSDYTKNYKWSLLKGEDGWGYEYIYYLCAEEPEDGVPTPHYNESDEFFNSDEYQKDDYIPEGWTDSQSGVSVEYPFEYVCYRKYVNGKWGKFIGSASNYSIAALCSKFGKDGQPGQDGKTIEYIYLLTSETPSVPKYDEDFINSSTYQENDFIPDEWQDSPKGISEDNPTEWFCTRKRDKTTQKWGEFQGPGLWAKWGVNGQDGDGVQYIYTVTADNTEMPDNPTPDTYESNTEYQDKNGEWGNGKPVTINSGTSTEYTWSDDPQGVSINMKTEWISVRKYRDSSWGPYSDPKPWVMFGKEGTNGANLRTMYGVFPDASTKDDVKGTINTGNIDPGSAWGYTKDFEQGQKLWSIYAYTDYSNNLVEIYDSSRNETIYGWQGPFIAATYGKDGADGRTPNYVTYVYASGDNEAPNKPTIITLNNITYPIDGIWQDYPNDPSVSVWYQCVGTVDGVTKAVSWGEVIPLNGRDGADGKDGQDGVTKDGKYYETRFIKSESYPTIDDSLIREPAGWSLPSDFNPGELLSGEAIYQTNALIDFSESEEGEIVVGWCKPFKISGETGPVGGIGPTGPEGPIGLTGLPGSGFELRYCLGKINDGNTNEDDGIIYNDNILNVEDISNYDSSGWYTTSNDIYSKISEDWPYVYCVQGEKMYSRDENNAFIETINWGSPFRLSGLNGMKGIDGSNGKNGQIIYPAGIYDPTKLYTLDDYKAPYVYDSKYGEYYVLNTESWKGTDHINDEQPDDYLGEIIPDQNGLSPGDAYEWWPDGRYWQKVENFEAIYADIGMFRQALVGQAVFSGNYMFSQTGIDKDGNQSNHYEYFRLDTEANLLDNPYDVKCIWKPAYCVNLLTGQVWQANGEIYFQQYGLMNEIIHNGQEDVYGYGRIGSLLITNNGIQFLQKDSNNNYILPTHLVGFNLNGSIYNIDIDNKINYWKLNSDGSGELSSGNILWDINGNLYLPPKGILTGTVTGGTVIKDTLEYQFSVYNGGNILDGTANVQLISSSNINGGAEDDKIILDTTEIQLPLTKQGTTSLDNVKGKYLILYIDDKIGARMDLTNVLSSNDYYTFDYEDTSENGGISLISFNANKYQYGTDHDFYWTGTEAVAVISFYNSGYYEDTFTITLNNCTSEKFNNGDSIKLQPQEEIYITVKMSESASISIN